MDRLMDPELFNDKDVASGSRRDVNTSEARDQQWLLSQPRRALEDGSKSGRKRERGRFDDSFNSEVILRQRHR